MIDVLGQPRESCDGIKRREILRIGGLSSLSLTLANLLAGDAGAKSAGGGRRARSCIFFFLEGAMAHQDTWDPKPDAPEEIRGEFQPINTTVPGLHFGEHIPLLAKQAHRIALVRSVTHTDSEHNSAAHYALTGRSPRFNGGLIVGDRRTNFPTYGAVIARLRPTDQPVPDFVHIPYVLENNGEYLPGQRAGFLGSRYDPLVVPDPTAKNFRVPGVSSVENVPRQRIDRRRTLFQMLQSSLGHIGENEMLRSLDAHYQKAFSILTSSATREACDLSKEPVAVRERYGPHFLGQQMLLARRLIEAGVRLVTVCWGPRSGSRSNQNWDTHIENFYYLKNSLLPPTDRCVSALLEDLARTGLLEETLVVMMGEFGRTPKINSKAGRDHWPHCYTVMLAGAGIRGGAVYGASDDHAAYPKEDPVTPEDIAATIYSALGVDPETEIVDVLGRPSAVALGKPITSLFS